MAKADFSPTPEQRKKMTEVHEKMAECLRSIRPASECHHEMMASCKESMGNAGCPMMGHGPMEHGMRGDKERDKKIKDGAKTMRAEDQDDEVIGKQKSL